MTIKELKLKKPLGKKFLTAFFGLFFIFVISLFLASCSKQESLANRVSENSSQINQRELKAKDFAPGQLQAHFLKHGYQFGEISESNYLEDARNLLNAPAGNDILEKVRANGDVEHYRPGTHEFAVMTKTGRIRTYFIANDSYWEKQ